MQPLVSVVIPAYNNADFLGDTVRSVLAQSYSNLEVVIADHASTDATWEVMQSFAGDERVRLLRTEAGGGALRNWNRVSQEAAGTYLKLVCGDDIVYPTLIEKQVAALESAPSATISACARDLVDANGKKFVSKRGLAGLSGVVPGREAIRATVRSGTNIFGEPACVLMRRDALERAGWWDSRFPYLIDVASYARVLLQGDLAAVDEALAAFRVSSSQWSVRLVNDQATQTIEWFRSVHESHPEAASRSDLRVGGLRARLLARVRQASYAYLGRRMKKSQAGVQ